MKLDLSAKEAAGVIRRRQAKGRQKLNGRKLETRENPKADRGRVRDNPFLAYLRRQPCEVCGSIHRVEAAHIRAGYAEDGWPPTGMQVKPSDFRALSLCAAHHREGPDAQHKMNEREFWRRLAIHPPARCAKVYADFLAGRDQPRRAP